VLPQFWCPGAGAGQQVFAGSLRFKPCPNPAHSKPSRRFDAVVHEHLPVGDGSGQGLQVAGHVDHVGSLGRAPAHPPWGRHPPRGGLIEVLLSEKFVVVLVALGPMLTEISKGRGGTGIVAAIEV
jgi:hypothetical protein